MVLYNRVNKMPATIITSNNEFKGRALKIPPLRNKIDELSGNLTESDILLLAKELYCEYQNRYKNDKEKWYDIKNNHNDIHCQTQAWRGKLQNFINKYKEESN